MVRAAFRFRNGKVGRGNDTRTAPQKVQSQMVLFIPAQRPATGQKSSPQGGRNLSGRTRCQGIRQSQTGRWSEHQRGTLNPHLSKATISSKQVLDWLNEPEVDDQAEGTDTK